MEISECSLRKGEIHRECFILKSSYASSGTLHVIVFLIYMSTNEVQFTQRQQN